MGEAKTTATPPQTNTKVTRIRRQKPFVGTGELYFLLWAFTYTSARKYFEGQSGSYLVVNGYPQWRNYLGCFFQLFQLPLLCLLAWMEGSADGRRRGGGSASEKVLRCLNDTCSPSRWFASIVTWGSNYEYNDAKVVNRHMDGGRRSGGKSGKNSEKVQRTLGCVSTTHFTTCFSLVFPAFILLDYVWLDLPMLINLHHIVCIIGHVITAHVGPKRAFAYYALGVTAFEIGGGCTNLIDIVAPNPGTEREHFAHVTVLVMTLSNIVGVSCGIIYGMAFSAHSIVAYASKTFVLVAVVGLAYLRETETIKQAYYMP
eukprot:g704.t1